MTLEENILKKNIPNKCSTWNNDDTTSETSTCTDRIQDDSSKERFSQTFPGSHENVLSKGKTGVKGVIQDFKHSREMDRRRKQFAEEERRQVLERFTQNYHLATDQISNSDVEILGNESKSDDDDSEVSDDEKKIMAKYRAERINEMNKIRKQSFVKGYDMDANEFGTVREVTPSQFSKCIDDANENTFIVVHLFDHTLKNCQDLDACFEKLAPSLPHIQFIKLHASSGGVSIDPAVLPVIMVYLRGELVHNIIQTGQNLPTNFHVQHLREMLRTKGVY